MTEASGLGAYGGLGLGLKALSRQRVYLKDIIIRNPKKVGYSGLR